MSDKTRSAGTNIVLVVLSCIVALLLSEGLLRVLYPPPISWKLPQELYIYDQETGYSLKPEQDSYTHGETVHTHSIGIRDGEYTTIPGDDIYRIVALGDSETFGMGLDAARTWPKLLESMLNSEADICSSPRRTCQVINGGVPATDTWQHEIIMERMLAAYHPNLVILAFYTNDVTRRFTPKPWHTISTNETRDKVSYILKQSVLLLVLRDAVNTIRQYISTPGWQKRSRALMSGEPSRSVDSGWEQVSRSLGAMKQLADTTGTGFLVISLPRRDMVSGVTDGSAYRNRLKKITRELNIPLLDLLGPLQTAYKTHGSKLFIAWDGHNSAIANRVIAGATRAFLEQEHNRLAGTEP